MDKQLNDLFDRMTPAQLDELIGDMELREETGRDEAKRLRDRLYRAVGRPRRRAGRVSRWAAVCVAAVLVVVLLGNVGLLASAAQWTQAVLGLDAPPIQGFREDGTAEFRDRRVDITTHTLLVSEETKAAAYRVELSDLTFGEPPRWKGTTAPHAYIYLYVDGRTADFGELRAGESLTLEGGPGTCLLVVVATVRAEISGTVTRTCGEVGP